jgi:hypothetical protein
MTPDDARWTSNPFSTRFVHPGAIPYEFPDGESVPGLLARLDEFHWRGQIVGPHGSGKSTLLAELIAAIERQGRRVWTISLRDGQRRLPADWLRQAEDADARLIVVDGYEQLGLVSRWRLKFRCRQRGWGLLVTAHQDVGLPTLFRTTATVEMAQALVEHLLPAGNDRPNHQQVADAFASAGGNLRETLFKLYDWYESTRR